ncbi:hypothetical protein ACGFYU_20260 [Streptomyces sp. NPDC048337]|uniref:hypothetical protein n=1 Tax=Streptomyces sp. NPDC048337 TaxID=3365535 RepID=UPI00371F19EB
MPEPAFEEVRPWFEEVQGLLAREIYEGPFDVAYGRIERELTLVSPDGPVAEFLLHVGGADAWFRWSDTPLATDPEAAG